MLRIAALGFAAVLLMAVIALGLRISPPSGPGGDAAAPPVATISADASPALSPVSAGPTPSSRAASEVEVAGVSIRSLGDLRGDYAFVMKEARTGVGFSTRTEIWSIPLDGREARRAITFVKSRGGILFELPPELRQLFSPDGRKLVISGPEDDLLVVDLVSGSGSVIGAKGWYPKWSRDGKWIAFMPVPRSDLPLGQAQAVPVNLIAPTGGPVRALSFVSTAIEWAPSGLLLVESEQRLQIVDLASGELRSRVDGVSVGGNTELIAFWRGGSPSLALTIAGRREGEVYEQRLDLAGADGSGQRTVVRETAPLTELRFSDPRWNPVGDELLYRVHRRSVVEIHLVDTRTGADARLPISASVATWEPAGDRLLFTTRADQTQAHELVIARRDGSGARVLIRGEPGRERLVSIASIRF